MTKIEVAATVGIEHNYGVRSRYQGTTVSSLTLLVLSLAGCVTEEGGKRDDNVKADIADYPSVTELVTTIRDLDAHDGLPERVRLLTEEVSVDVLGAAAYADWLSLYADGSVAPNDGETVALSALRTVRCHADKQRKASWSPRSSISVPTQVGEMPSRLTAGQCVIGTASHEDIGENVHLLSYWLTGYQAQCVSVNSPAGEFETCVEPSRAYSEAEIVSLIKTTFESLEKTFVADFEFTFNRSAVVAAMVVALIVTVLEPAPA